MNSKFLKSERSGVKVTSFKEAKNIKEGQLFMAFKSSVEGRDKVTLIPVEDTYFYEMQDNPEGYEHLDDSFDDMDGEEALARGYDI